MLVVGIICNLLLDLHSTNGACGHYQRARKIIVLLDKHSFLSNDILNLLLVAQNYNNACLKWRSNICIITLRDVETEGAGGLGDRGPGRLHGGHGPNFKCEVGIICPPPRRHFSGESCVVSTFELSDISVNIL